VSRALLAGEGDEPHRLVVFVYRALRERREHLRATGVHLFKVGVSEVAAVVEDGLIT
jgi:hypothetical protein